MALLLSLSVTVSLCHCVSLSLCLTVPVSLCPCVSLSLSPCVSMSLSHCGSASLCVSEWSLASPLLYVCVSVCMYGSVSHGPTFLTVDSNEKRQGEGTQTLSKVRVCVYVCVCTRDIESRGLVGVCVLYSNPTRTVSQNALWSWGPGAVDTSW